MPGFPTLRATDAADGFVSEKSFSTDIPTKHDIDVFLPMEFLDPFTGRNMPIFWWFSIYWGFHHPN